MCVEQKEKTTPQPPDETQMEDSAMEDVAEGAIKIPISPPRRFYPKD